MPAPLSATLQYNVQLPSNDKCYGLTKGHAVAFPQDAAVLRASNTVPDLAFAEQTIAVTFLGPPPTDGVAPRHTPVLERALGLGGDLRVTADDFFMWARFLRDCNPRDAWRLASIDDTPAMRQRVDDFVKRLLENADYRDVTEEEARVTIERSDDLTKPLPQPVTATPPVPVELSSQPQPVVAPATPIIAPLAASAASAEDMAEDLDDPDRPVATELTTLLMYERVLESKLAPARRVLAALDVARGDEPECMYTSEHTVLGDGNPHIFTLGQFPFGNSIPSEACCYYMLHHRSQRCQQDPNFMAQLADQLRRAQCARSCTALFKADPESFRNMVTLLESPDYVKDRAQIIKDPTCPAALELLEKTKRSITIAGSKVDFHPLQRASVLPALHGYTDFFGPHNVFFTMTPDDTSTTLIGRLVLLSDPDPKVRKASADSPNPARFWAAPPGVDVEVDDESGSIALTWQHKIADHARHNAVAVAEISSRMFEQVMKHLFGMELQTGSRECSKTTPYNFRSMKPGVLGTPLAAYAINECQARGQLHWHCQMHVSLPQWVFQHGAGIRRVADALLAAIGTQITTAAAPAAHVEELMRKVKRQPRPKFAMQAPFQVPQAAEIVNLAASAKGAKGDSLATLSNAKDRAEAAAGEAIRAFGNRVVPTGSGAHEHRNPGTCSSGPVGFWMCRLGYCRAPACQFRGGARGLARRVAFERGDDRRVRVNAVPAPSDDTYVDSTPFAWRVFELPKDGRLPATPPDDRLIEYALARPLIDPAEFTSEPAVLTLVYFAIAQRRIKALTAVFSSAARDDFERLQDILCHCGFRGSLEKGFFCDGVATSDTLLQLARLALEDGAYNFPVGADGRPPHAYLLGDYSVPDSALVEFLDALSIKNLLVSETSAAVAAATGASSNAQYLCGTVASYIVGEYMADYMAKDKHGAHALVAFIASAFKHIHDYPSKAADVDEPESHRLARTFLQRVINSVGGHMEVSMQQCGAAALKIRPQIGTHDITFVFHAAAAHYRAEERGGVGPDMVMHDNEDSDGGGSQAEMDGAAVPHDRSRPREVVRRPGKARAKAARGGSSSVSGSPPPRRGVGKKQSAKAPRKQPGKVPSRKAARRSSSDAGSSDTGAATRPRRGVGEKQSGKTSLRATTAGGSDEHSSVGSSADGRLTDSDSDSSDDVKGNDADPRNERDATRGFAGRAIAVTRDDGSRAVFMTAQHTEYDHRGDDLRGVSLFQWAALVQRELAAAPSGPEVSVEVDALPSGYRSSYPVLFVVFRCLRFRSRILRLRFKTDCVRPLRMR